MCSECSKLRTKGSVQNEILPTIIDYHAFGLNGLLERSACAARIKRIYSIH